MSTFKLIYKNHLQILKLDERHNEKRDIIQSSNKRQNIKTQISKQMGKICMVPRDTKENLNNWERLSYSYVGNISNIKMSSILN